MIHLKLLSGLAGVIAAATVGVATETQGVSVGASVVISLVVGAATGGATFGAVRNGLRGAHHRIDGEREDRILADGALTKRLEVIDENQRTFSGTLTKVEVLLGRIDEREQEREKARQRREEDRR